MQTTHRTKIIIKTNYFRFLFSFHVAVESFKKTNITFKVIIFSVLCHFTLFTFQYWYFRIDTVVKLLTKRHFCVWVIAVAEFPPVSVKSADFFSYHAMSKICSAPSFQVFRRKRTGVITIATVVIALKSSWKIRVVRFVSVFVFSQIDLFGWQYW